MDIIALSCLRAQEQGVNFESTFQTFPFRALHATHLCDIKRIQLVQCLTLTLTREIEVMYFVMIL